MEVTEPAITGGTKASDAPTGGGRRWTWDAWRGAIMTGTEFGVVVAVGPDGVQDGVLDFAAAEALRRGTGVELVHVVHSFVAVPSAADQIRSLDNALLEVGRAVLTAVAERLRPRLRGRVPVGTEVLFGPVAATIAARAATRDLLVLERREPGGERLLTMSVSTRLAARAQVPVAVVPHGWAPGTHDPAVTVGVDHPIEAAGQVEPAAAYAAECGRPLRVLHAMWLAEAYQDTFFVNHARRKWTEEADRELRQVLDELDVVSAPAVTREVRWVRPVEALVGATRRSSVLVLSRRTGRGLVGADLGPVTRAVLHHAECPVLLVDRS